jgi:hypothetical protein
VLKTTPPNIMLRRNKGTTKIQRSKLSQLKRSIPPNAVFQHSYGCLGNKLRAEAKKSFQQAHFSYKAFFRLREGILVVEF